MKKMIGYFVGIVISAAAILIGAILSKNNILVASVLMILGFVAAVTFIILLVFETKAASKNNAIKLNIDYLRGFGFNTTHHFSVNKMHFFIDDAKQEIKFARLHVKEKFRTLKYSDITDFEIVENGNSVYKGGLGRAVAGGILFGGVGAIVGGATANKHEHRYYTLQLKIYTNDLSQPVLCFDFLPQAAEVGSYAYEIAKKEATTATGVLKILQATAPAVETDATESTEVAAAQDSSPAPTGYIQELKELDELRKSGVITEEEFQQQKSKILGR